MTETFCPPEWEDGLEGTRTDDQGDRYATVQTVTLCVHATPAHNFKLGCGPGHERVIGRNTHQGCT